MGLLRSAAVAIAAAAGACAQGHHGDPFAGSNCTCDTYCAGTCALFPSAPTTVTLYRMTPLNVDTATDKNTGDAKGDTSYIISRRTMAFQCKQNPKSSGRCGSLIVAGDDPDSTDLIIAFEVEVDGQWGPYLYCNPDDATHPDAAWNCTTHGSGGGSHHSSGCDCPRMHQSVGRRNLTQEGQTQYPAGGLWYSTPHEGECQSGSKVGDGCSWRIAGIQKAVNASCMYDRVDTAMEARNQTCFSACPTVPATGQLNRTTGCYSECYTYTTRAITSDEMAQPWHLAFGSDDASKGGCPVAWTPAH